MVANFLTQLKSIVSKYKGLGLRSEDSGPWRSQLAAPLKNRPLRGRAPRLPDGMRSVFLGRAARVCLVVIFPLVAPTAQ